MVDVMTILNEKDPYLREVYSLGFDGMMIDESSNVVIFINRNNRSYKEISRNKIFNLCNPLTIRKGVNLLDGSIHEWISEADGSAKRFRDMINGLPEINKKSNNRVV